MIKFVIVATFVAVALCATTKAECDTEVAADLGVAANAVCTECQGSASSSSVCSTTKDDTTNVDKSLKCTALTECYAQVEEDNAKKAAEAMTAKYGKYCPTDKTKCADKDNYCATWAKAKPSQCTENPDWMLQNCYNSCCPICTGKNTLLIGTCPEKDREDLCVKNTHSSCNDWATQKNSECDANPKWMKPNCMQSCCDVCKKDKDGCPTVKETCKNDYATPDAKAGSAKCEEWAKAGECTSNPNWMKKNCSKECCPICKPVAPKKAASPAPQRIIQQPQRIVQQPQRIVQQPQRIIQQQPQRIIQQQPQRIIQQPQRIQQPVYQPQVSFGGYQTGLPYYG